MHKVSPSAPAVVGATHAFSTTDSYQQHSGGHEREHKHRYYEGPTSSTTAAALVTILPIKPCAGTGGYEPLTLSRNRLVLLSIPFGRNEEPTCFDMSTPAKVLKTG